MTRGERHIAEKQVLGRRARLNIISWLGVDGDAQTRARCSSETEELILNARYRTVVTGRSGSRSAYWLIVPESGQKPISLRALGYHVSDHDFLEKRPETRLVQCRGPPAKTKSMAG